MPLEFARKLAAQNPATSQSFHGYKFRIGSEQSVGVVLVAYLTEYRASGVMTLVVLPGGSIYEKDLGSFFVAFSIDHQRNVAAYLRAIRISRFANLYVFRSKPFITIFVGSAIVVIGKLIVEVVLLIFMLHLTAVTRVLDFRYRSRSCV